MESQGCITSDITAGKEYGVTQDFIMQSIRTGKLEYQEGSMYDNPYLKILRSQLEQYIAEQLGASYLGDKKVQTELRQIKKEISRMKKKLATLESRKVEIEAEIEKSATK